jgi:hypothetical protein
MLQHWYHSRHGDRFRLLGDIDVRLDGAASTSGTPGSGASSPVRSPA